MTKWRPSKCKDCGRRAAADVPISKQGFCGPCGTMRAINAIGNMNAKRGPEHDRFVERGGYLAPRLRRLGVGGGDVGDGVDADPRAVTDDHP